MKKLLLFLLITLLALSLVACGGTEPDPTPTPDDSTPTTPEDPAPTPPVDPEPDPSLLNFEGVTFSDLTVTYDGEEHIIEVAGKEVTLSFKEYSLLMVLLEAEGNVVSRDTLLTRVWGEYYDESRTLDVHIRKLRMKLETAGELIQTVKNIGYKLGGNENG